MALTGARRPQIQHHTAHLYDVVILSLRKGSIVCEQELGSGGEAELSWELGSFLAQDAQLLAVQQLLIKGLFKPETEISTIQVCAFLLKPQHCMINPGKCSKTLTSPNECYLPS